jgi:hypothetical protein
MTDGNRDVRAREPRRLSAEAVVRAVMPALMVSLAAGAWCWHATGPGLGLFLGLLLLATLYMPGLIIAELGRGRRIALSAGVCGTALVWLISVNFIDVSITEWLRCVVVFTAYVFALAGLVSLLQRARFPEPLAAGVVVLIGLLWLTWPVWMSPWLTQRSVNWLVPANPVFAINSVLKHLGTWDHAPIAYRALTNLNQDVPYQMPQTIFPATIVHLLIGTIAVIPALRNVRKPSTATA